MIPVFFAGFLLSKYIIDFITQIINVLSGDEKIYEKHICL